MASHIRQCDRVMAGLRKGSAFGVRRGAAIYPAQPGDAASGHRDCDSPGCSAGGTHRAPKAPDRLDDYYWFCLDHVREYNRAWNYCAGMNPAELEREVRRATTWDRPSWRLGARRPPRSGDRIRDPFNLFGAAGTRSRRTPPAGAAAPDSAVARALAVMDLTPPVSPEALKARYKSLVKRNHPDRHGGSRESEERLKLINEAYTTLKGFIS